MRYGDLFDFEPLESVKELKAATDVTRAEEDVRTFVISDRLAEQMTTLIIPHLRFDQPAEGGNKGLLIVANYGTGKTHLMSVISAVAEHGELSSKITNDTVAEAITPIGGKFKVIRAEIGATKITSLYDLITAELKSGLSDLGVSFKFSSNATNSKDDLAKMMQAFEAKYPDQGLLFALDELLDYLRALKDGDLIQALTFLREIGEVARSTRFRFIAGIQEAIFDNPRFAHVADAVQRVKDRFEQARISREDVSFVVQRRLLKKSAEQRAAIRDHLTKFSPMFEGLAERMDDFVEMYPVHPAYLRTFELITAVEKRTILKTISQEMRTLVDKDVPDDAPGVLCSDSYRAHLAADPSFRAIPAVREVLDRTEKLTAKIDQGMTDKQYVPTAKRIIDGLAVHRLTTDSPDQPVGMTPENLRDELFLLPPGLPKQEARFLATTIRSILGKVITTVSGQFISENEQNGQFYLDVDKDIDFDRNIEVRAESLDKERLDDAYFQALEELLELRTSPYVSGYRIWEYQVKWVDHNVNRIGYLFMGAPNERSTAQPPRDYYIYFLQAYAPPKFEDARRDDEVFFRLEHPSDDFSGHLRRYAGAAAMERENAGRHREVYADKRKIALRKMIDWLRDNLGSAVTVTYRGTTKPLAEYLGKAGTGTIKTQIDTIASQALIKHFEVRYPGYPVFAAEVTKENLGETVRDALTHIASGRPTVLSGKILSSLELLDAGGEFHAEGPYAKTLAGSLADAGTKVLNRKALLSERDPGLHTWEPWHLEPGWLVVVAAALVRLGRAEIGFADRTIDAITLDQLPKMPFAELEAFSHIAPPKELPVLQLRRLAKLLGLQERAIPDAGIPDDVVRELISRASALNERVAKATSSIHDRGKLWGSVLFDRVDELEGAFQQLGAVLQDVRARDTAGKMSRLELSADAIDTAGAAVEELDRVEAILSARDRFELVSEYLREAATVFGKDFELSEEAELLRTQIVDALTAPEGIPAERVTELRTAGDRLRKRFAEAAAKGYRHHHLDAAGDARKRELLESQEFSQLASLATLDLLPGGVFAELQNALAGIPTLMEVDDKALQESVVLDGVAHQPQAAVGMSAQARLEDLERRVGELHQNWTKTLAESLNSDEMKEQIALLAGNERERVTAFVDAKLLPGDLDDAFVSALGAVFRRFHVRPVTPDDLWAELFPGDSPATLTDLRSRFEAFANRLAEGAEPDSLRIVPKRMSDQSDTT